MDDTENAPREIGLNLAMLAMGALIGAVAALLVAPKSGQELRTRVIEAAGSWKEQAADTLAQGRERVISAIEQSQERIGAQT